MNAQGLTDRTREQAIEEAKSALGASPYAPFAEQAPRVRLLLENLPVLQPDAPVLQSLPADRAARWDVNEMMGYLAGTWIAGHSPHSHEAAIRVDIVDEPDLLVIAFHMYLWSLTSEVLGIVIARVADDTFLCWERRQSSRYETPRQYATPTAKAREGLPGLRNRVLTWVRGRDRLARIVEVLLYAITFGVVGAVVGAILGGIWGFSEGRDVGSALALGGALAILFGAGGIVIGAIYGVIEAR